MIEILLKALKAVVEDVTKGMYLEVNPDTGWYEETAAMPLEPIPEETGRPSPDVELPEEPKTDIWGEDFDQSVREQRKKRAPEVYLMNLPDRSDTTSRIPYILIQFLSGRDKRADQENGRDKQSTVDVRLLVATYNTDGQEGGLQVLNILERMRFALQSGEMLASNYVLQNTMDYEVYPDDTGRYFLGEMDTTWSIPTVERTHCCVEEALNAGEYRPGDNVQARAQKDIWEDEAIWS